MASQDKLGDFRFEAEDASNSESRIGTFLDKNKVQIIGVMLGLIFIGLGVYTYKLGSFGSSDKVEILRSAEPSEAANRQIVVEISGEVEKPGVYRLEDGSRVEDLLISAGGISASADRDWVEKYINRAAKLSDGQKLYIMKTGEQSEDLSAKNTAGIKVGQETLGLDQGTLVNINTASLQMLDSLPGIGQVYGQSIIDHRPYSDVSELLSKGVVKQNVYDKVKDLVTVY